VGLTLDFDDFEKVSVMTGMYPRFCDERAISKRLVMAIGQMAEGLVEQFFGEIHLEPGGVVVDEGCG